jgi:hypothetical protein
MEVKIDIFVMKLRKKRSKQFENFSIMNIETFLNNFVKSFNFKFEGSDGKKIFPSDIKFDSAKEFISGFVAGGSSGKGINIYNSDNTKDIQFEVGKDQISSLDYFIAIHTPSKSNLGILMIQGYSDLAITSTFCDLFKSYYQINNPDYVLDIERHIPRDLNKKFIKKSTPQKLILKKLKLSSDQTESVTGNSYKEDDFSIEITIKTSSLNFFKTISKDIYSLPILKELNINDGLKSSIQYNYEGKNVTAKLDADMKFEPTYYLDVSEFIINQKTNLPTKESIRQKCMIIFEEIKREIK